MNDRNLTADKTWEQAINVAEMLGRDFRNNAKKQPYDSTYWDAAANGADSVAKALAAMARAES